MSLVLELLLEDADQQLFDRINSNVQHVLHRLLPPPSVASQHYELRRRAHSRELPARTGRLTDSNFVNKSSVHGHLLMFIN